MIPIYKNEEDKKKESHDASIKAIKDFLEKYDRSKFDFYAVARFDSGAASHEYHGKLIVVVNNGLVIEAIPIKHHKHTINWRRPTNLAQRRMWMHPSYDEQFPAGKYENLIHTYAPMDLIQEVYAKPITATNSDLKPVLQIGLD